MIGAIVPLELTLHRLERATMLDIDEVTKHYAICSLWASTDDDGEPLDAIFGIDDIDLKTYNRMRADCEQFLVYHADLIDQSGMTAEQCGHDIWLTRNRHGAGFWDRGYPAAIGDALTQGAHLMGEVSLLVGDDGTVYQY